ncbi:MAG: type II toxin-antitoxin system RelE/ParE family toxin [Gemmatimonadota bacterium]|nr:type II toxin-antitoxin system RelE/ParE family toxin [Gemmatimonadota bacterium]
MVIRSVRHKGLRRLLADNDPRFVNSDLVARVRRILTVLVLAEDIESFAADAPRSWRFHRLTGDRRDVWSVSVSGNWRMTFNEVDGYIDRLNLEDYH